MINLKHDYHFVFRKGITGVMLLICGFVGPALLLTFIHANLFVVIALAMLTLMSLNAFLLGFALLVVACKALAQSLLFSRNALIFYRLGRRYTLQWKDLRRIRRSSLGRRLVKYRWLDTRLFEFATLSFANGTAITIGPEVAEWERLLSIIERIYLRSAIVDCLVKLKSGEVVDFGSASVSTNGLSRYDQTIPWDSVTKLSIPDLETLSVKARGVGCIPGMTLAVRKTDNVCLLLSIIAIKSNVANSFPPGLNKAIQSGICKRRTKGDEMR